MFLLIIDFVDFMFLITVVFKHLMIHFIINFINLFTFINPLIIY